MKPSISDFLILFGLLLLGVGFYFWIGRGVALVVVGALVLLIGIAGNITEHQQKLRRK